ncbi:MAG: divergent polysaccharide deacetylase family protein [Hyphomicrobiales bacterium]
MPLDPDDLHTPLGLSSDAGRRNFAPSVRVLLAATLIGAGVGAISYLAGDADHAGEPFARAEIAAAAPQSVGAIAKATPEKGGQDDAAQSARGLAMTGPEIEGDSGVTVVRPGGGSAPGALVIQVPGAPATVKLAAAPDPRLIERGEFGPLPRIGTDGARPAQVYARPAPAAAKGRPRIALVIGGLGLNDQTTAGAMSKLPGEVSLAFAPYGANLRAQTVKAREAGHEILLQMPMEPFDYPQNNPGPQTLTTDAGAAQNLERLHWVMARTSGFVGIENFLGARFTADEAAVTPILKDLADRGLVFLDDGSSARSIAPAIGASLHLPVQRADMVIDAAPNAAMIDAALERLEAMAREKGLACASGSALPVTIERLSHWAATLSERGIDLVPVTATLNLRGKS